MMGEPLEVPQQQEQQHQNIHHQQTAQSLIPPSATVEDCWDTSTQQQTSSRSGSAASSNLPHPPSSSFGGSTTGSGAKGPRRTRHRVDAGEPRGCFNSANNSSFFQPRNIFTSPLGGSSNSSNNNSVRGQQHSTSSVGGGASPLNTNSTNSPSLNSSSPYHHHPHHPLNHQFNPQHLPAYSPHHHGNSLGGPGHFNPNPGGIYGSPKGQDAYYFQPMKMLSDFISTQQAAAAAVAASSGNSAGGLNGQQFPGGVVPSQLLLREMLSKSNSRNNPSNPANNNNNNNLPGNKCGYEEDVVMDGDGDQEQKSGEKAEVGGGIKDEELEGQSSNAGDSGAEDGNLDHHQLVKVEAESSLNKLSKSGNGQGLTTSSSSTSTSSGKSATTTTSASGMRINGCKKRKLYQPQQRSDFDEAEEEELDDDDYDSNVLEAAMARSRQKDSPPILTDSPLNPPTELVHEEEDEEEEMRLMDEKEDFDENFDDDDDEDDLVTSNRTTPNNNNNNNTPSNLVMHNNLRAANNLSGLPANASAAPLTRQLLTERSSNEQKPSSLSLLRTSSSPKIVLNSNGNRENMRRRDEIMNHFDHTVPFGANPQAYFLTWKENFKSTLITHITDLVDSQFSLLFPGQSQGQGGGNHNLRESSNHREGNRVQNAASLLTPLPHHRESHNNSHLQNHHHHHQGGEHNKASSRGNSVERTTPQKNPASLLLNGGTVSNNNMNNNNNNNNNNNTREKFSPPAEKIPKMDLRGSKNNDFHPHGPQFPRYPFQVHPGNNASLPTGREQNGPVKGQNFSSALMGLSQAAQMQHHAAAAAAAAAAAGLDMFDDGPLSLVVRGHNHETPRKKRHKVTDTRLTPRAVSRLLGQVDNYGDHHSSGGSPSRRDHDSRGVTPPPNGPSSGGSGGQANLPQSLPTSVAIPNPSLNDSRLFTPYAPLFHHHPGHPGHHRLDSPPMGTSLIHPALLANPAEYVQQLRAEMSREERNADLRESRDHIRAVRDSGSISCGGGPGSAGSDSGETNSYADLPGSLYSCGTSHSSSTLTPMHLRKAKLMFFWVRYPSSSVIKMYFPDIKFNKNNTAQLVKWFSNFREFYYIQMEKYARQALSEGIKNAEDLHVTIDNELYRVLNLHYNRNNHIEVPTNFRFVVEQTLREFFKAIQQGKDQEQSWKKAIYKIIARLDDPVPEYFKSPNFLEQLE